MILNSCHTSPVEFGRKRDVLAADLDTPRAWLDAEYKEARKRAKGAAKSAAIDDWHRPGSHARSSRASMSLRLSGSESKLHSASMLHRVQPLPNARVAALARNLLYFVAATDIGG
jgi:hypothetical protein